jgi:ABC-2 type transport system permease protein
MAEEKKYNQWRAMFAITRASLRSIFRSPSAVVFSLVFPLIFMFVFGFMGDRAFSLYVGIANNCDSSNIIYQTLQHNTVFRLIHEPDAAQMEELQKGKLDGILTITKNDSATNPPFILNVKTSDAAQNAEVLLNNLQSVLDKINLHNLPAAASVAEIKEEKQPGRIYRMIDFILPGMLGFSLLSTGVFGTAFVFLNLRNTLVIKRFFATPIQRSYIVLGEGISRVLFALLSSGFIIVLGYFFFKFTLVHGLLTFIYMLILSFLGLFVFMGFGFVISGIAKDVSTVPPLANIITLPQFLLAGTFFSTDALPGWLQNITRILPLTYLNDAMRKVSFEGAGMIDISHDLLILGIWGVIVYAAAVRVFKWE